MLLCSTAYKYILELFYINKSISENKNFQTEWLIEETFQEKWIYEKFNFSSDLLRSNDCIKLSINSLLVTRY